ncbi:MAG: Mut7-C RNAse domain-containing protein [Gammaproteobacteria bacterium]
MAVTDDPHAKPVHESEFRFYEELNDFLPPARRRQSFRHRYTDTPSVKDAVEALGVPHTEIDVILVDGRSVGFGHRLRGGERVAVYPVFERLDVSPLTRLRPRPLRVTRFIADVHLGTLARYLRLLGFDTVWRNDLPDEEIIERSLAERRIILTRDVGILRNGRVTHGYWPRSTEPLSQLEEVVHALQLGNDFAPYSRCLECNGECVAIGRREAARAVPLQVFLVYRDFRRCNGCGRVYWPGSHVERLDDVIRRARLAAPADKT